MCPANESQSGFENLLLVFFREHIVWRHCYGKCCGADIVFDERTHSIPTTNLTFCSHDRAMLKTWSRNQERT